MNILKPIGAIIIKLLLAIAFPIRVLLSFVIITYVILYQEYISPYVYNLFGFYFRRYLSSIVNLVCFRVLLACIGVSVQHRFGFFNWGLRPEVSFKSGAIGIVPKLNFIDFLFYACIFNPTFVRMVELHDNKNVKLFAIPLRFKQAFYASLNCQGFDPLIVKSQQQLRKLKIRRLQLKSLAKQSMNEKLGPIMIILPGIPSLKKLFSINPTIIQQMWFSLRIFNQCGLLFSSQIENQSKQKNAQLQFDNKIQINQLKALFLGWRNIKYKCFHQNVSYSGMNLWNINQKILKQIDKFYINLGYEFEQISYSQYKQKQKLKSKLKLKQSIQQQNITRSKKQRTKKNKHNFNRSKKNKLLQKEIQL